MTVLNTLAFIEMSTIRTPNVFPRRNLKSANAFESCVCFWTRKCSETVLVRHSLCSEPIHWERIVAAFSQWLCSFYERSRRSFPPGCARILTKSRLVLGQISVNGRKQTENRCTRFIIHLQWAAPWNQQHLANQR